VKYSEKIGELRKVRLGFVDQSVRKAWYIRQVTTGKTQEQNYSETPLNRTLPGQDIMFGLEGILV